MDSTFPPLLPSFLQNGKRLLNCPSFKELLTNITSDDRQCLSDQLTIAAIESPRFGEENRRNKIAEILKRDGLNYLHVDDEGNLIAIRKGLDPRAPRLVLSGHMDTVFPPNTPTHIKQEGNRYYAPGIGDDAKGVAVCLQIIRTLNRFNYPLLGDLIFVATVGEEGNGDLRGSNFFFKQNAAAVDGFISIDGIAPNVVTSGATGSRRYKVEFDGVGGHSYKMFGIAPSAAHALCRAVTLFADITPPTDPRTTFTVGLINAGTSVNSIASHAELQLDMRSNTEEALDHLEEQILPCFERGAELENAHYHAQGGEYEVRVKFTPIGNRPCGTQSHSSPVLQACRSALELLNMPLKTYRPASTDANVPISLGIPAATIGAGGLGGKNHTIAEWYEHTPDAFKGPQAALLSVALLLGVQGICEPLLKVRHFENLK